MRLQDLCLGFYVDFSRWILCPGNMVFSCCKSWGFGIDVLVFLSLFWAEILRVFPRCVLVVLRVCIWGTYSQHIFYSSINYSAWWLVFVWCFWVWLSLFCMAFSLEYYLVFVVFLKWFRNSFRNDFPKEIWKINAWVLQRFWKIFSTGFLFVEIMRL